MQTVDPLWDFRMVQSCPTEDFLAGWEPGYNHGSTKPVRFPAGSSHSSPSQVKEISCFLNSRYMYECKNSYNARQQFSPIIHKVTEKTILNSFKSLYFGYHTVHTILVYGHFPLPINDQIQQELVLLCNRQPYLQDHFLPMLKVHAVVVL